MENNIFEEVLNLLVDVKVEMQKLKARVHQELVRKIDVCISKVAPLIDVYASTLSARTDKDKDKSALARDKAISLREISTFQKKFEIKPINAELQAEELLKVKHSFIKEESPSSARSEAVIDYFLFKYDFKLKQYIILGRQGGEKSDRRVFLDLFTDDRRGLRKVERTESMTNVLKVIFTPDRVGEVFILPNCQEEQIKYLFLFALRECGCAEREFFEAETLYCFVARRFILGELTNLMHSIAKIAFERRVSDISPNEERLHDIVENFNAKKTYLAIEEGIENFLTTLDETQSVQSPRLTISRMERWKSNTMDRYLERSALRWSLVRRGKGKDQQQCCLTLALLFYFAVSEYKIILISLEEGKHVISELIMGLLTALQPLTFIYPIVTATITPHHMEFTNSPVPLLLGLWGAQDYYAVAKSSLKKLLRQQRDLSKEELLRETPLVVFDLDDHTLAFLEQHAKDLFAVVDKMQAFVEMRYEGTASHKFASFTADLLSQRSDNLPQWAQGMRSKLHATQMYEYFTNKNH